MVFRYISVILLVIPLGLSFFLQQHGRNVLENVEVIDAGDLPKVSDWVFGLVEMDLLPLPFLVVIAVGAYAYSWSMKGNKSYSYLVMSLTWLVIFLMTVALLLAFTVPLMLLHSIVEVRVANLYYASPCP